MLTIAFISVTLNMAVPTVIISFLCVTVILTQIVYSFSCEKCSNFINRAIGLERMGESAE